MSRIDTLTGLRALAAFWVICYHVNLANGPLGGSLGPLAAHGSLGVDIFFVLSGFVLSLVYVRKLPGRFEGKWYKRFLLRRVAKIYPLHLLTLGLMVVLVMGATHAGFRFTSGAENTRRTAMLSALLLHAWGFIPGTVWNSPSWSVSAEWFAYLVLFAPMVFALRRVPVGWLVGLAAAVLAVAEVLASRSGVTWTHLTGNGIIRIVPEFLCGYVLYRLVMAGKMPGGGICWREQVWWVCWANASCRVSIRGC